MSQVSTLQDFPLDAGIQAIKDSLGFTDFDAFYEHLLDSLPQNSPVTRRRYASLVVRWLFPERRLGGFFPRVWDAYRDEQLLRQLTRVTVLEVEPVIARFVMEVLRPLSPGAQFDPTMARDFVTSLYGSYKENSYKRLLITARRMGFIERWENGWIVSAIPRPADALLILLHARMAPTPQIVRVADLLNEPFWCYLGLRQPDEVRSILHDAHAAGLLARYSTVDQLEQITTRYTLDEYLGRALRLRL